MYQRDFGCFLIPHCLFLKIFCKSIYKRALERAKSKKEGDIKFELIYGILGMM